MFLFSWFITLIPDRGLLRGVPAHGGLLPRLPRVQQPPREDVNKKEITNLTELV